MSAPASSREQFDVNAASYATSEVHRAGPSLPALLELAAPTSADRVLDVATGTGNTALALAPLVAWVVGLDLSERMLEHARERATREGLENVSFRVGEAERLPYPDASFSLVTSRHAPHHFRNLPAFLREAFRVLAPGGRLVVADQVSPSEAVSPWIHSWEATRDPSHFRQRTREGWEGEASAAGFAWTADRVVGYRLEFGWWVSTAGCSEATVEELRRLARTAPPGVREAMKLEYAPDGEVVAFTSPVLVVRLKKPGEV